MSVPKMNSLQVRRRTACWNTHLRQRSARSPRSSELTENETSQALQFGKSYKPFRVFMCLNWFARRRGATDWPQVPLKGDVYRRMVAVLSCILGIGLSSAHRLPRNTAWPLILAVMVCFVVAAASVFASKSRAAVIAGILLVLVFRILIGGYFYLIGAYRGH
jgi:hypothetical protein